VTLTYLSGGYDEFSDWPRFESGANPATNEFA